MGRISFFSVKILIVQTVSVCHTILHCGRMTMGYKNLLLNFVKIYFLQIYFSAYHRFLKRKHWFSKHILDEINYTFNIKPLPYKRNNTTCENVLGTISWFTKYSLFNKCLQEKLMKSSKQKLLFVNKYFFQCISKFVMCCFQ